MLKLSKFIDEEKKKMRTIDFIIIIFILLTIFLNMGYGKGFPSHTKVSLHGLGLIPEIPEKSKILAHVNPLKLSLNVRKTSSRVDNSYYLPPVGDQGNENSCVGWAMGYYLKGYQEIKEHKWSKYNPQYWMSPYFVYNHINGGKDNGSFLSDAAKLICNVGVSPFEDFISHNYTELPSKKAYFDAAKYRTEDYHWIYGVDNLRQLLANGKVAVLGIYVWDNLYYISSYGNVYTVADRTGVNHGGHAVLVVGFDDNKYTKDGFGAFKIVNSWGDSWGDNGFFWMSYRAVMTHYMSTGWAIYLDDKIDYHPETFAAIKLNHSSRGDIIKNGIKIEFENRTKTYLNFSSIYNFFNRNGWKDEYQSYPFPPNHIVFDITDIAKNVSEGDKFYVIMNDSRTGNTGKIESFEVYYLPEKSGIESPHVPINIPDNGTNIEVSLKFKYEFNVPIHISSDEGFYELNGVFSGEGTSTSPYIIEDYRIDAHGRTYGIRIENTTSPFILKNCEVYNTSSGKPLSESIGIYLKNVENGVFKNNTIRDSDTGFELERCKNNKFFDNKVFPNFRGFYVEWDFDNDINVSNTVNNFPVYYYHERKNFNLSNVRAGSIIIANSQKFRINNISIENGDGIRIINSMDGKIYNFKLENNPDGFEISSSSYISLQGGLVNNSLMQGGIKIFSSGMIKIRNVVSENSYNGFYIEYSDSITIQESKGIENIYHGIFAEESPVNINKCIVEGNTIDGIHIQNSANSLIEDSKIIGNYRYGVYVFNSYSISIINNTVSKNYGYGIYLLSSSDCIVYLNSFYFNNGSNKTFNSSHIQAYDDGNNIWNSTAKGNYWADWQTPDINHDGIVDKPYPIDGSSHSMDYFPIKKYPPFPKNTVFFYFVISITIILIFSSFKRKKLIQRGNEGAVKNMHVIFKFKNGEKKIEDIYRDELLSRQSIVKRDGKSLGLNDNSIYLMIEGSEEAMKKARKIAGENELKGEEREKIYRKIKESEEEASLGMGAIFG